MPIALLIALVASLGLHTAALFGPDLELPGLHDEIDHEPPLRAELLPPTPRAVPAPPVTGPRAAGAQRRAARRQPRPTRPLLATPAAGGDGPAVAVGGGNGREDGGRTAEPGAGEGDLSALHAVAPASLPDEVRIRYAVFRGEPGFELGRTQLSWESHAAAPADVGGVAAPRRYRAAMTTETAGLAALIKPVQVTQESQGDVTAAGLKPRHFFTARDGRRQDWADFDWGGDVQAGIPDGDSARVSYAKGDATVERGAQDFLSLFFQFAWLPGFPLMPSYSLTVATGKKISQQLIIVQGEEIVEIPAGTFRTLHVKTEDSEPIELWLALDYYALPVKMRYTDRRGDRYDQLAVDIRSSAPAAPATPPAPPNANAASRDAAAPTTGPALP